MKNVVLRTVVLSICAACILALSAPAMAHETRTEGGIQSVVGWATEPAYVGYPNAVQLRLSTGGAPITDLGPDELKVEVQFGDQKTAPLALSPAFGSPGEYLAPLMPTRAGDYSFRFFGTIRGEAYDQTFESGEETFDSPKNPADVSFPAKDPTVGELAARVDQIGGDGEEAAGGSDSTGMLGLGVAVAALALAVVALVKKNRAA
jgi:hypothetical protein